MHSAPPWTEQSIYHVINSQVDPESGSLRSKDFSLPDEPPPSKSTMRWAAGSLDGVMGHHAGPGEAREAHPIAKALDGLARTGDSELAARAYALLEETSALSHIDASLELLAKWNSPAEPHLSDFAIRLTTSSAHREAVKAGIALLGAMRLSEYRSVVTTLGLHEEFTLYAATALRNILDDPAPALWSLARKVDGWGRIQLVERLVPTDNEDIRKWLRTEGFKNSILYEYLALTAAVHGHMCSALERDTVDHEELASAGKIIHSMIAADRGPGGGMDQYPDAGAACLAYLHHVQSAVPDLRHLEATRSILDYVDEDERDDAQRLKCGWTESIRTRVRARAQEVIEREGWRKLIEQQLGSEDEDTFWLANSTARQCGFDAFEWHWRRVQAAPRVASRWYDVMQTANAERIDQVLALAEESLPLNDLATGPADEMGLGKEFELHSCLDFVLQDLRRFPAKGAALIVSGLRSPVVRNRHMAVNAIEAWDKQAWTTDLRAALQRAVREETDSRVADRIRALLAEVS